MQGDAARPDRRSRGGLPALSVPAVGRHAAARRHRHRAGLRPEASRPRRTDDRIGCDGRGERPRPRPEPPGRDERGGPADRPQPRRHPDAVRPRRGDVRRQDRRGGRCGERLREPAAPVHARPAALPSPAGRPQVGAGALDDPRATCRRSARTCRRASSSTAARSRPTCAGRSSLRSSTRRDGGWTRCHYRERLGEIVEPPPIVGPRDGPRAARPRGQPAVQDVPPERTRRPRARRGEPRAVRRRDARPRR